TARRPVERVRDGKRTKRADTLTVEEPMEIRLDGRSLTVTMRTPGNDFDLATGFLVSEGVVWEAGRVSTVRYCAGASADGSNTYNLVDVKVAPELVLPDTALERNFYTTSSCGLCGKASMDAVETSTRWPVAGDRLTVTPTVLATLPSRLRQAQ